MDYLRELTTFYDWLETNPLSTSSIALWYALMHINNKIGWTEEFAVAVSVLCVKTGLSTRAIYDARNELKLKERLDWKSRHGNQSAVYRLQPLCAIDADKPVDNTADKPVGKGVHKPTPLNKPKDIKLKDKTLYLDFVFLSDDEYKKLIESIGQAKTDEMIDRLNTYGHTTPKKFKAYGSHYHVILTWIKKDEEVSKPKQSNPRKDPKIQSMPNDDKKKAFIRSLYV